MSNIAQSETNGCPRAGEGRALPDPRLDSLPRDPAGAGYLRRLLLIAFCGLGLEFIDTLLHFFEALAEERGLLA